MCLPPSLPNTPHSLKSNENYPRVKNNSNRAESVQTQAGVFLRTCCGTIQKGSSESGSMYNSGQEHATLRTLHHGGGRLTERCQCCRGLVGLWAGLGSRPVTLSKAPPPPGFRFLAPPPPHQAACRSRRVWTHGLCVAGCGGIHLLAPGCQERPLRGGSVPAFKWADGCQLPGEPHPPAPRPSPAAPPVSMCSSRRRSCLVLSVQGHWDRREEQTPSLQWPPPADPGPGRGWSAAGLFFSPVTWSRAWACSEVCGSVGASPGSVLPSPRHLEQRPELLFPCRHGTTGGLQAEGDRPRCQRWNFVLLKLG